MPRLAAILILLFFPQSQFGYAAEMVCRYCRDAARQMIPQGMKLEGKYHYAPDRQVDVQHIKVDIKPDFGQRTIQGTTTISVTPILADVRVLKLDAYNLRVRAVRCDAAEVEDIIATRRDLRIVFKQALSASANYNISIDYEAQPEMGLYFRTPEMGYPNSDVHIWTQGEAHESQHWYPCFDYPNERSTSEVICHVPPDMTVLSNGRKLSDEMEADGLKAVHWIQEKPHVNYLICLVAGHFAHLQKKHGELELGFYSQPSVQEHAANSFEETDLMMKFFEEEIGMPFPWAKYDQVTLHDFIAGGMENTTLSTLMIDTVFSTQTENLKSSRGLVAHELAHQWFGDFVTCKDWSHLWLNEGFATYYANLYEGERFGRDAMLYELYKDAYLSVFPNSGDKRPIVYNQYTNPMEQFDFRTYPKAGWVLHMLRSHLGPETYRRCIQEYLRRHELSDVVSDDLRQVIEDITGKSMDRFFDQWIYHAGTPKLRIAYDWIPETKLAKLSIQQTQEQHETSMLFELPARLRFHFVEGQSDHSIVISKDTEDFYFALPQQPTSVRFDPDYELLAEVEFEKSDDMLLADLRVQADMVGRLLACKQLANRKTQEVTAALREVLVSDLFYGVRLQAADSLGQINTPESQLALQQSWAQQMDARVRLQLVELMLNQISPETRDLGKAVLTLEKNPAIRAVALSSLAKYYDDDIRTLLIQYLNASSFDDDEARAAINAIGTAADETAIPQLIEMVRRQAKVWKPMTIASALETIGTLNSESTDQTAARVLLVEYTQSPRLALKFAAIRGLGKSGDLQAIAILEPMLSDSSEDLRRTVREALDEIRNSKPLVPAELKEMQRSIHELQEDFRKLKLQLEETEEKLKSTQTKMAAESSAATTE